MSLIENHFKFRVKFSLERSKKAFREYLMSENSPTKVTVNEIETKTVEELREAVTI